MPAQSAGIALNKQLVVALPAAGRDIDTDSIALLFNNREIRYLSGVRWTSPAPNILQRSLIDALTAAKSLRGVTDESAGILADAKLLCDLRQFSLHYPDSEGAPTAVITGIFRLLNLSGGSIMDVRRVHVEVPASDRDTSALALACETALSRCLAEVTPWVIQTMARSR
jgi:cholesterol transport system auxiliary component